jgi:two-component system, NarL family, invasion response regulator UvrY
VIRLLIADDHAIVRRGVRDIINEMSRSFDITEASSAREALKEITTHPYSIVIMDVSFPDGNGLDILKQAMAVRPETRVLFLSMYPEEQYARRALKNGAYGYLTKDSAPTELVSAIERVISGSKYVTRTLAERLVEDLAAPRIQEPHEKLSDREFQVMLALARGEKITDISEDLLLSPKTVSTYRARILQKLNLQTTAELIRYVMDRGLGE